MRLSGRLAAISPLFLAVVACVPYGDPSWEVWVENHRSDVVYVVYADKSEGDFTYVVPADTSMTIKLGGSGQELDVLDHACAAIDRFQVTTGGRTQVIIDGGLEIRRGNDAPSPDTTAPPTAATTRYCQ